MALVNVVNMVVLDNPTCFTNPFQFEITFECLQELDDDLEWKVLYVGSAQDATRDQILDEILVGPVPVGVNKFVLQADAPDPSQLAQDDLLGVTVVLVTCSYREREFVRVGYYVNNEYHNPNAPVVTEDTTTPSQQLNSDGSTPTPAVEGTPTEVIPPSPAIPNPVPLEHIQRQILADKPRVTKFPISWGDEQPQQQQQQTEGDTADNVAATSTVASMMAEASSMMAPPPAMTVDNSMMMMMQDGDDNNNDDAGVVSSSGVVSMPEESNMSHNSYFGSNHSNGANGSGVQAMAE